MPDDSGASAVNTGVHTHYQICAHRAAGALGTRHSPRPLIGGRTNKNKTRASSAARSRFLVCGARACINQSCCDITALSPHPLMSQVKRRDVTNSFSRNCRRSVSRDDRARVEAEPRDVGQQALIRGFTHFRWFVWGCPGLRTGVDLAIGHTG